MPMFAKGFINAVDICPPLVPCEPHHIIYRRPKPPSPPPFIYELINNSLLLSHSPGSQCLSSFMRAITCSVNISEEANIPLICWMVNFLSNTNLLRRSDTLRMSFSISLKSLKIYPPTPILLQHLTGYFPQSYH